MQNHDYINIEGYQHISNVVNEANQKLYDIRNGTIKPIITSSKKETDKIGGMFPTDQIVIAGRTGIGKTADLIHRMRDWVDPLLNPSYVGKIIILYDSWEMPAWRGVIRMYSRAAKMSVREILDYDVAQTQEAYERILAVSQTFKGFPIYFRNISDNATEWYNRKYEIQKANPDKIIINLVDHARLGKKKDERSEEEKITNFMLTGMKVKLEMNQINVFLSQMNRAIETSGKREEIGLATPVSSDLFGADSLFQCADIVIAHHRPGFYGIETWNDIATGYVKNDPNSQDSLWIECILKQRDGWTGNIVRRHNLAHNEIFDEVTYQTF